MDLRWFNSWIHGTYMYIWINREKYEKMDLTHGFYEFYLIDFPALQIW